MKRAVCCGLGLACLVVSARAASLEVEVDGIEPGSGTVYVALCQGGLAESTCRSGKDAPADGRSQRVLFKGIEPGVYAVVAYQDINGNGRIDRTGLGLPLEPYGVSRGGGRRARPDFATASFPLDEPGAAVRVRLARTLPSR
ncbi:DUF2141 domain-containing protein [Methylobacterium gnaphalii]|uniref:DUF2141 domain-containing protein n=1 Tax=Methylobacterium gnaphalii TaxID=1010610 RepID=A0A512JHW8_9HYPH|nr:DUF2141 domain-containing protein [Methylobacterium gnaphalii]GEP09472.1 hypothetical protein MGN01_13170 [Methylobacterium gnaphalii]GJD68050.1 hypothetical protein MMMDOFMJ_0968 [Methylobacterium gnaphalii]GLS51587.1 hypothetical protein GCM10007885_44450 [Methylobacterium gnaphalii]